VEFGGVLLPGGQPVVRTEGTEVTVRIPPAAAAGTTLRLGFEPMNPGDGIASLSAFASGPQAPPVPPTLTCTAWKRGLALSAVAAPGTHHVEVLRKQPGADLSFELAPGLGTGVDAPLPGPVTYLARSVGFDGSVSPWSEPVRPQVPQRPASPGIAGCVEGFYGRPWTWPERIKTIRILAASGLTTYVYAPKDDPFHRERWKDPYPPADMQWFERLRLAGAACGVDTVFAISPGLSMDPASDSDFETLCRKLQPFLDLGYRSFALLMDDISASRDRAGGQAHAALAARLARFLAPPGARLLFVGTVYAGTKDTLDAAQIAYLRALGRMPAEIPIMWTGDAVFDAEVLPAHAAGIAGLIGRKPLLWDNYPVNDFFLGSRRLFLSPVTGRSQDAVAALSGVLSNPMTHQAASRPALVSYGDLLAAPETYRPVYDPADLFLVLDYAGDGDALALLVADNATSPMMQPGAPSNPELAAAARLFLETPRADASLRLDRAHRLSVQMARRYVADARVVQGLRLPALAEEIWPGLLKRKAQLEVGLATLSALCSSGPEHASALALARALDRVSPGPLDWIWFGLDEPLGKLLSLASAPPANEDPAAWPFDGPAPELPDTLTVGRRVEVDLRLQAGAEAQVHATLPAGLDSGRLWLAPDAPGEARVVVIVRLAGAVVALTWSRWTAESP
jgi:hyaluronoglucosaminidase